MFNGESGNATLSRVVRACDGSCLDSGATNNLFPEALSGDPLLKSIPVSLAAGQSTDGHLTASREVIIPGSYDPLISIGRLYDAGADIRFLGSLQQVSVDLPDGENIRVFWRNGCPWVNMHDTLVLRNFMRGTNETSYAPSSRRISTSQAVLGEFDPIFNAFSESDVFNHVLQI